VVAMSVINQMLKNIDEQKRDNKAPETRDYLSSHYVSGQQVSLAKMISLIIFVIFLVVLITAVTIYKFDIFNNKQDVSMALPLPINQEKKRLESNNQTTKVKQNQTEDNDEANVLSQESSTIKNVIEVNSAIDKSMVKKENKTIEKLPKSENTETQDIVDSAQESSVIKSTAKMNLKAQSEKLFNQAQSNLDRGNIAKARQQLSRALDANNKNHRARLLLLTVLLENGNFKEMQKLLDTSLNQWSNVNEYRQLQARLYLEKGDKQQALSILQQDIPSIDESVDYHALLAFIAQQTQQDELAAKHFQLLLQFNNSRADWWLGFAVSQERLGNKDLAFQAYNQSIKRTGLSETVKNYARQRIQVIQGY
jgi:Flp pilus assembly protein TadD